MKPGHPAGQWSFMRKEKSPPDARELRDIFDEQIQIGSLSADSWLALMRLGRAMDDAPQAYGALFAYPDDEEFDPELLGDSITEARLDELYTGGATPTEEERSLWFAAYMDRAHSEETSALNVVVGWELVDDQKRERLMVTYQEDQGTFGGVAGLYLDKLDAAALLASFGDFEWYW